MKKILVPTDFSDTSRNAVEFAGGLAAAIGAEIELFHAYQVVKTAEMFVSVNDIIEKDLEHEYAYLVQSLHARYGVDLKVTYKYVEGYPVDVINREAKQGFDLVVIGMQGKSALEKLFLGSVATGLLRSSKIPVLAVPNGVSFNGLQTVIIATDGYHVEDPVLFGPVMEFARIFNCKIDLFYHRPEKGTSVDIRKHFTWNDVSFDFHIAETDEDTHQALDRFVHTHEADLLVMLHHRREFWSRIFNPSFTKAQAKITQIPLLILPV